MHAINNSRSSKPDSFQESDRIKTLLIERGLWSPSIRLFTSASRSSKVYDLKGLAQVLHDLGGIFRHFSRYLGTRVDLFQLEDCSHFFASSNPQVSQTATSETHYGTDKSVFQKSDGSELIAIRPQKILDSDFDLVALLKRAFQRHLPADIQFDSLAQEFRADLKAASNTGATSDVLESFGTQANAHPALFPPKLSDEQVKPHLVVENPPGIRLDAYLGQVTPEVDPFFDGMESKSGYVPEEISRAICDGWLHLVFNCGIAPIGFDSRDLVIVSSNQLCFVGGSFKAITSSARDSLRKYLIHSCNDDPAKALQYLLKECDTSRCNNLHDVDRLFRQLVPFRHGGWNDEGSVNSCVETIFAQIRLLTQQGIHLNPAARDVFRGMYCLARTARQLSPIRDSLDEGIKNLRLQGLLENAREILDPIHWTAQTDKMIGLLMLAPKNFDQAIDRLGPESQDDQRSLPRSNSKLSERALLLLLGLVVIFYGIPVLSQVLGKFQRAYELLVGWGG